jgi:hypothetical protein
VCHIQIGGAANDYIRPNGKQRAFLFRVTKKQLPRPAHKGGGLFQTARLLEEELPQLRCLGGIEGAEPQIGGDVLSKPSLTPPCMKYGSVVEPPILGPRPQFPLLGVSICFVRSELSTWFAFPCND